jgi:hypothetical protein
MSLRSAVALDQGLDDSAVAAVTEERLDTLDARGAAAVAVADAFLGAPLDWSDEDWRQASSALTEDEVAEIVLRLTHFTRNKVRVALRLDVDEIRVRPF